VSEQIKIRHMGAA